MLVLLLLAAQAAAISSGPPAIRCVVTGDPDQRVYELRRTRDEGRQWMLVMRSRKAGAAPVILPLPDARPSIAGGEASLSYSTANGGRAVEWRVTPELSSLEVHANFELEVNVEADLDPRVELMNTDGPLTTLSCRIAGNAG